MFRIECAPMDERPAYRTMREFSEDERPRERLLRHGPELLADAELIAIVLGSGMFGENVLDFARRILDDAGGLPGLQRADAPSLHRTKGLGPAKAAQIAAAIELGRRVGRILPSEREAFSTPEQVYALLGWRTEGKPTEELYVLPLDMKSRLLGANPPKPIAGGVNAIGVRPAEVFREAIVLQAASVILAHNHPSGDAKPSPQDVATTRELVAAGKLLEIDVLDHVVLGQGGFISLRRESLVTFAR